MMINGAPGPRGNAVESFAHSHLNGSRECGTDVIGVVIGHDGRRPDNAVATDGPNFSKVEHGAVVKSPFFDEAGHLATYDLNEELFHNAEVEIGSTVIFIRQQADSGKIHGGQRMTAIAYRNGIMAADTVAWIADGIKVPCDAKIVRHALGLFGCCGGETDIHLALDYLTGRSAQKPDLPRDGGFECIWAKPDGTVWYVGYRLVPTRRAEPFVAIGRPQVFMMGAMFAGASAEQAVRLAVEHTDGAGGDVQVERLAPEATPAVPERLLPLPDLKREGLPMHPDDTGIPIIDSRYPRQLQAYYAAQLPFGPKWPEKG